MNLTLHGNLYRCGILATPLVLPDGLLALRSGFTVVAPEGLILVMQE